MMAVCFEIGARTYGIDFKYIREICGNLKVTSVPCLGELYLGMCIIRNDILPVADIGKVLDGNETRGNMTAVVEKGEYVFCFQIRSVYIKDFSGLRKKDNTEYSDGEEVIYLIDIDKCIEKLKLMNKDENI